MDIQAYIESGIIESYVLGIADAQEVAELEGLRRDHPEIAAAISECERWLYKTAGSQAIPAADNIRESIFSSLENEMTSSDSLPLQPSVLSPKRNKPVFRYLAAASLALLIVSAGANIYLYYQYKQVAKGYIALLTDQHKMLAENQVYQTRLSAMYRDIQQMSDSSVQKILMRGVPGKESNLITVYWNVKTKDVYLLANRLPKAPEGRQYQLWAIVNGKPVDAGMLTNDEGVIMQLKSVKDAQAFAVTLENAGGSATPTLDQMYVFGKINS
ncbi:anti-sigma-K factor rskA [Chitinophaga dinghuensis]|uniref:Anti-sigma-K factor rskA n=1 Tax=Chitinophaga dinghuensis TaxID=1539050 RepID=A0A327VWM9_9BACT|nr:anti-sigma factor [Chitinophaga dinghuensis]RAJ79365.1 anti-sigma-K factor rskA [Chitinophaga dinghuensis]